MNRIGDILLKGLRKAYNLLNSQKGHHDFGEEDPDKASDLLYNLLSSDQPCMIARFGSVELYAFSNGLAVKNKHHHYINFIKGKYPQWWWNEQGMKEMQTNAGFFPPTPEMIVRFSELMYRDIALVDVLGSWRPEEKYFEQELEKCQKIMLLRLEPYWSKSPWSRALRGKKILVVHPFAEDIRKQYENNRERLFVNPDVLPEFESLRIIKAVQSIGGEDNGFADWFEALDWMKQEMDNEPYDIALIGCGAYGFPLAAHAKRTGHKAVHLGGALQLLFGIRGKRWENPSYNKDFNYTELFNKYWISPKTNTQPLNGKDVEGGCYW